MSPRLIFLLALVIDVSRSSAAELAKTPPVSTPVAPATATAPAVTPAAAASASTPASTTTPPPRRSRTDSTKAPATTTPTGPQPITFESFRLISDRNIFNPNRTGQRTRSDGDAPPRLDVISLVGTMESDRGLRAFFEGSTSAYRKALRAGESVDSFKVTQVSAAAVELEREGKNLTMRVGQQLRRPAGGEWNLVAADVVRSEAAAAMAKANAGKIDPTAPVVIPDNVDPVTRRLMEKRNQDLKK